VIRFRPLPVMSVLTIAALAVLVGLGRWQWERYDLKVALADAPVPEMTIASYQPIEAGMQFVHGLRADTREQGWRVFVPVQFGETIVFVDADFIAQTEMRAPNPAEVRVPALLRLGDAITGATIRPAPPAPLTLAPRPLERLWFAIDLQAMARNAGLANVADYYVTAAYMGADGRARPNPFARAAGADDLPPARHLGYALTWYGLAAVLLAIYFAYHVSTGRLSFGAPRRPEN